MKLPLAVCTRYDELGASSRLRYYAYRDALEEGGFAVRMLPFFGRAYLERLYGGGGKSRWLAAAALLRRLAALPGLPERLLIEYELLPSLPAGVEQAVLRHHRYVLNFDDNVWEKYAGTRLEGKYDRLIAGAAGVIVANDFLAEKVVPLNANCVKIPTVVELAQYRKPVPKRQRFTLVWAGTPVTYRYLELFAETLRAMAAAVDFELLVLARKELEPRRIPGVPMVFEDWSAEREAAVIASAHAGIMPLTDDAFSWGKSAYKIIQYLAAGLPVIASPVGENVRVVTSECGFLARTPEEWCAALNVLADSGAREALAQGAAARAEMFSLEKYRPILVDFLRRRCGF